MRQISIGVQGPVSRSVPMLQTYEGAAVQLLKAYSDVSAYRPLGR